MASTSGWDTVFVSGIDAVNASLESAGDDVLTTFSYQDDATGVSFNGDFGPWQVVAGGESNELHVCVPMGSGTLNAPGVPTFDLAGVEPVVSIDLTLMASSSGDQSLNFDVVDSSTVPSNQDGTVYVVTADQGTTLAERDPSGIVAQILSSSLPLVFVDNAQDIGYVFATILADPSDNPWLTPKATAVSYFESTDASDQALGLLTLVDAPWSADGLSTSLDPSLAQGNNAVHYSLSPSVFLHHLVLPVLPQSFGNGVDTSYFSFHYPPAANQPTNTSITNAKNVPLGTVKSGLIDYYPIMTRFSTTIQNGQVVLDIDSQFDITGLHDAYVTLTGMKIVDEVYFDEGSQTIKFRQTSYTDPDRERHVPWYEEIVPGIDLIIDTVVHFITDAVQDAITGVGDLSVTALPLDTAVWTGLSDFDIQTASLTDALALDGTAT